MNCVNPNQLDKVTSSSFNKKCMAMDLETWTPTRSKSTWSMLLILPIKNAENSHTSPTSPKTREETTLGSCFPNELFLETPTQSCLGLRHKIQIIYFMLAILLRSPCQLRLWSCAGASTTHLGCSHHAKGDQASDTTHSHRCLATEILSSIWTWDCHCWQPRASIPTI